MTKTKRDNYGRFVHGHPVDLLRDSKGRFKKKDKEKAMDKKQDSTMVEDKVDALLNKKLG